VERIVVDLVASAAADLLALQELLTRVAAAAAEFMEAALAVLVE
jgi:hypothetical protein